MEFILTLQGTHFHYIIITLTGYLDIKKSLESVLLAILLYAFMMNWLYTTAFYFLHDYILFWYFAETDFPCFIAVTSMISEPK